MNNTQDWPKAFHISDSHQSELNIQFTIEKIAVLK